MDIMDVMHEKWPISGAILILVEFLLQCFDVFCYFNLVENSQILDVKTVKNEKTSKSNDFEVFAEIRGIEPLTS